VGLLGLGRGGRLTGPDGPYRLVGDDHVRQVHVGAQDLVDLLVQDGLGPARLALIQFLTDAVDHPQARPKGGHDLLFEQGPVFADDVASLAVPDDHRLAAGIQQHARGHLAGERPFGLAVAILGAQPDGGAHKDLGHRQQQGERRKNRQVHRNVR